MDPHIVLSEKMCPKIEIGMSEVDIASAKAVIALMQMKLYRSMLGACSWIANTCHPAIAYVVDVLQHLQANRGPDHWGALLWLSSYLKKTRDLRLIFRRDGHQQVVGFTEADWGRCVDDRKSVSGYMFSSLEGL